MIGITEIKLTIQDIDSTLNDKWNSLTTTDKWFLSEQLNNLNKWLGKR